MTDRIAGIGTTDPSSLVRKLLARLGEDYEVEVISSKGDGTDEVVVDVRLRVRPVDEVRHLT